MEDENNYLIQPSIVRSIDGRSLSKKRWIVLSIVSLTNICNAGIWISLAPVSDRAALFYETDQNDIDLFSTAFFVSTIIVGLIAMWTMDRNGLMLGIYIGSTLTALGISIRALSSAQFVVNWLSLSMRSQFIIAIGGQVVAGCAQPFVLFSPTKVAELWFSSNERALATTVTGMSNPMGIVLGNVISPLIVTNSQRIPLLSIVWLIPSLVTFVLTIIFIRSSKPPTPPSNSAEIVSSIPYIKGLKELLTQKAYLLLMLYMGTVIGMFSTLITILEQILKVNEYEDDFSSVCIAVMIGSGLVGSTLISYIVSKTKEYITPMKLAVGLTAISINGLFISLNFHSIKTIVITFSAIFGFFGFMAYPLGLELGIECSFPAVQEATSSGLLILSGQLQGIAFIYLSTQLANESVKGIYLYRNSLIIMSSFVVFISCLFIIFFFTEYKRLKYETSTAGVERRNPITINDNSNAIYS